MDKQDEEFQKRLLSLFKIESQEHLNVIASGLAELEKKESGETMGIIERIYRESHSLKGAACSVNWSDIVAVCQALEDVFSALKRKDIIFNPDMKELLLKCVDWLERLIGGEDLTNAGRNQGKELVRSLTDAANGKVCRKAEVCVPEVEKEKVVQSEEAVVAYKAAFLPQTETVRIATDKLDALLLQAEELLTLKNAVRQRSLELRELKKEVHLNENSAKAHEACEKCEIRSELERKIGALLKNAEDDNRLAGGMIDKLLSDIKEALMLPIAAQLDVFPRFVRELARDLGKQAELVIDAGEIEIDRRVIEEIKDPLLHLLRNAMVHGIEEPQERILQRKAPCGTIRLKVSSNENKIEILLADDGKGIDVEMVKLEAVRRGIVSEQEASVLKREEALRLIFSSEVSTAPLVTDAAGRGLGLAIVQEKIEKLNGAVSVTTNEGTGTEFLLKVPISLATFRGLLVKAAKRSFILPADKVERVLRLPVKEVATIENCAAIRVDGELLAVACLATVLGLETLSDEAEHCQITVLRSGERKIGFIVDEILQEQEILAKPLGRQLLRVRNISGAAVIGDGKVVPILHVPDLLKSSSGNSCVKLRRENLPERKVILLVDDSITARSMLKNILESAGYAVIAAIDGAEGLAVLQRQRVNLVISDVNMPRLDGFMLTEKIRSEKNWAKIPVVLVTSMEAEKDREKGMEAGANAYIVKRNFEKHGLLEIIRRLI